MTTPTDPSRVPAPEEARRALRALVDGGRTWQTGLGDVPQGTDLRRSAVLLLFGPLEASDHDASHQPGAREGEASALADVDLLLTRRSDALRHHPGQVAFPGGGIDEGEGTEAAALREAVEETGLEASGVEVLGALSAVPVLASGNVVVPVLAWWRRPSALVADGVETAEVFRVPVRHLVDPRVRGTVTLERGGRRYTGPAFAVDSGHVVWGFTAHVLDALLETLGWAGPWDRTRPITPPDFGPGAPSGSVRPVVPPVSYRSTS